MRQPLAKPQGIRFRSVEIGTRSVVPLLGPALWVVALVRASGRRRLAAGRLWRATGIVALPSFFQSKLQVKSLTETCQPFGRSYWAMGSSD